MTSENLRSGNPPLSAQRYTSEFANDPDMKELVETYVQRLPMEVAKMISLLEEKQIDALRRVAHQLKGSGGGYGFARLTELAAAADAAIKQGAALEQIGAQVDSLITYIRDIQGYNASMETIHATKHPNH